MLLPEALFQLIALRMRLGHEFLILSQILKMAHFEILRAPSLYLTRFSTSKSPHLREILGVAGGLGIQGVGAVEVLEVVEGVVEGVIHGSSSCSGSSFRSPWN